MNSFGVIKIAFNGQRLAHFGGGDKNTYGYRAEIGVIDDKKHIFARPSENSIENASFQ